MVGKNAEEGGDGGYGYEVDDGIFVLVCVVSDLQSDTV